MGNNPRTQLNSSVLSLKGSADEIGDYTCHSNNTLGQARFKTFTVTHIDRTETIFDNTIVGVSVSLVILLLISIAVAVRF